MKKERIVLVFPRELADKPLIFNLARGYDLTFNILKAAIMPNEEGRMVLELSGDDENFSRGIEYLKKSGLEIEPLSKEIIWVEGRCTHCGYCVGYCPTGALSTDSESFLVTFDPQKCTACGICVDLCPFKAVELKF